jgi:ribosomal protein S6
MKIYATNRFQKGYDGASLGLKNLAEGAIYNLIRRHRSNPATLLHNYDSLAHLDKRILEIDVSGGHRLLAEYSHNCLILLDVGKHEIVGRYSKQMYSYDRYNYDEAPGQFWPELSGFFQREPDQTLPIYYSEELSEKWLYFLESQQQKVDQKLRSRIWKMVDQGNVVPPYFIAGGPGTGKTCLLLNLLHFFHDISETRIAVSEQLADYIERSTGACIEQFRVTISNTFKELDLLLVDDPSSLWEIERVLDLHRSGVVRAVVIAFDPLQLKKAVADEVYDRLVREYGVHTYILNVCYRQKENPGRTTKHVIDMVASSTPYAAEYKIEAHREQHQKLTTLANEIVFVNPAGYVQYYVEATVANIQSEVNRILREQQLLWRHYPGLLVVEGLADGYTLSEASREALLRLQKQNYIRWISSTEIEQVKGLEFQHVFIFISLQLYQEIQQGFSGSGTRAYENRKLLRIPFSRAKDSLVTFAL